VPEEGSCEHKNENSPPIKWQKILEWLRNYYFLKLDFVSGVREMVKRESHVGLAIIT
jgi:hypothetical protein